MAIARAPRPSSLLLPCLAAVLACELPQVPAPDFPTGLSARASSGRAVEVSWEPAARADRYVVHFAAVAAGAGATSRKVRTTSYKLDGLAPGTRYLVQVRAQNDAGDSLPAETLVATLPVGPSQVSLEALEGVGVRLSWSAVTSAAGYRVRRIARGVEELVAGTVGLVAEDRTCVVGERVAYRVEALPGPDPESFVEVRGLCGRRREVCALDPSGPGALVYEAGGAGERAPAGSFGLSTGLFQPLQVAVDALHDEVVILDRLAVGNRVLRRLVTHARGEASGPLRTLGAGQAPFDSELAGFALDASAGLLYLTDGASLFVFDRTATGATPAKAVLRLSGIAGPSQPIGSLLALDEAHQELFAFWSLGGTVSVIPLGQVRALAPTLTAARQAQLFDPVLGVQPTRLLVDPQRRELGLFQASGTSFFDALALSPGRVVLTPGLPGGAALDAGAGELWLQAAGSVSALPLAGGDELRSITGPSTGLAETAPAYALEVDAARGELLATGQDGLVVLPLAASGDVAPLRSVGEGRGPFVPRALAFDAARGERFVLSRGRVSVFAAGAGPADPALRTLPLDGEQRALSFDAARDELWVLSVLDKTVVRSYARDASGSAGPRVVLTLDGAPSPRALLSWGDELFVAAADGISVFSRAGTLLRQLVSPGLPVVLEADRERDLLFVADGSSTSWRVYPRTAAGSVAALSVLSQPGKVLGIVRDARTDEVLVLDDSGQVQAYEVQGAKAIRLRALKGAATGLGGTVALGLCR